jgi:hypothetical protein
VLQRLIEFCPFFDKQFISYVEVFKDQKYAKQFIGEQVLRSTGHSLTIQN